MSQGTDNLLDLIFSLCISQLTDKISQSSYISRKTRLHYPFCLFALTCQVKLPRDNKIRHPDRLARYRFYTSRYTFDGSLISSFRLELAKIRIRKTMDFLCFCFLNETRHRVNKTKKENGKYLLVIYDSHKFDRFLWIFIGERDVNVSRLDRIQSRQ